MNNSTDAKKQNRVLVISVSVIAVFAMVMILLTALPARETEEEVPPPVTGGDSEKAPDTAPNRPTVKPDDTKTPDTSAKPADTQIPDDPEKPDLEAGAKPEDLLPDFIAPVSGVLAKGHSLDVPVYSLTMDDYRTHTGVDIAAEIGTPVRAAAAGTVTDIWEDPMMGKCLRIAHTGGAVSVYKNLAEEIPAGIEAGTAVKAGAVIGAVGESALIETAESAHLHYELSIDGTNVNPADFMLIGTSDNAYEG